MVGVIVVNHRTPEVAARCVDSLRSSESVDELVVVDTGGEIGAFAGKALEDRPRVIALPENRGFGAAVNSGATDLAGDFLLVTNADIYFEPRAVDVLLSRLQARPDWALAAPLLRDPSGAVQESSFRFPGLLQTVIDLVPAPKWLRRSKLNGRYPDSWATTRDFEIDHPLGACMLVRRAAFDAVLGFDESFFMYAEELDLCRRLRQAGWKIGHVAGAEAVHLGGASTRQNRYQMVEALYISRARYFEIHHSARYGSVVRLAMAAGLAVSPLWNHFPRHRGLGLGFRDALALARRVIRV